MSVAVFLDTLSVPAGTGLNDAAEQLVQVVAGRLIRLRLYVPPGPRGEVYLRLLHGAVQIAPVVPKTWWRPDDATLDFLLDYEIPRGELEFYLSGASPNANFAHTIPFELSVETPDGVSLSSIIQSLRSSLASAFGE